jgi:hypothetical protein
MAGELVLVNPRSRSRRKSNPKHRTRRARRRNPITAMSPLSGYRRHRARRRNPIVMHRRRRNPIAATASIGAMAKNAVVGGVGAVAIDALFGQLQPMLPASLQTGYGYTAMKAGATLAIGILGKRVGGGIVTKAAEGALICQTRDLLRSFLPASITMGAYSPAMVAPVTQRHAQPLGSYVQQGMGAYIGASNVRPMNAYVGSARHRAMAHGNR